MGSGDGVVVLVDDEVGAGWVEVGGREEGGVIGYREMGCAWRVGG
jgi:hypothetical protein